MDSIRVLISLTLLLIAVHESSSYDLRNPAIKSCATLYKEKNLEIEALKVSDGSLFSNLEEEHETSGAFWNVTQSVHVEPGCTLTACKESYFNGECTRIPKSLNESSTFGNILSVKCECAGECKCEDMYKKFRKNECARAFVKNGCNTCNPLYVQIDLGFSETFPDEYSRKVRHLMVKPGCQLTVYEEENRDSDYDYKTVQDIRAWSDPVRSYECSCVAGAPTPPPQPPEKRSLDYPPMIDIPNSAFEIHSMLNGNYSHHPALLRALQSYKGKRSTKNAYILLLGTTGSGKSSTINMLFDNPKVTLIGDRGSTTNQIHEFRIPVPVDELGMRNSELRVIDTPGMGDTKGWVHDARFLATLEDYLDRHEELNDKIPNVVLIFHKFSDNRYSGSDSAFVRMMRGFDSFQNRLTDRKYSNVIFVFSHFLAENPSVTKNPKEKLMNFKKVTDGLGMFPSPYMSVVAENKPEGRCPLVNGYYKLPNGEYYPSNLFDKITKATLGGKDGIGDVVIRTAFKNPEAFQITSHNFPLQVQNNSKSEKYMKTLIGQLLGVNTNTEVSKNLEEAYNTMSPKLKSLFPKSLAYLMKSLNVKNFVNAADMPKTTEGIIDLLTSVIHNDAILYLLEKAFGISPPDFKEKQVTGYSYNVFKDEPLTVSPYYLGRLQNTDIGYRFPSMITCTVETQNKGILEMFRSRQEYLDKRLLSLTIEGKIPVEVFKGTIKSGHNIIDQNSTEISTVRELRRFKLVLNDKLNLTAEFVAVLRSLSPFNASNLESVTQWKSFFDTYGTHVVQSVYGGGAVELKMDMRNASSIVKKLAFKAQTDEEESLEGFVSFLVTNVTTPYSLRFVGGNTMPEITHLTNFPPTKVTDMVSKWRKSLLYRPTMLTTEMSLLPLSQVGRNLRQNISSEIERATRLLFDSNIIYIKPIEKNPVDRWKVPTVVNTASVSWGETIFTSITGFFDDAFTFVKDKAIVPVVGFVKDKAIVPVVGFVKDKAIVPVVEFVKEIPEMIVASVKGIHRAFS